MFESSNCRCDCSLITHSSLADWNIVLQSPPIPGVYDFAQSDRFPAPIPAEQIEVIRGVVERGASVEPHPFLKCGDRVKLKTGPLEGIEGILVRKKNFYRLVVSVELLERSLAVEVDAVDVERVTKGSAGFEVSPTLAGVLAGHL